MADSTSRLVLSFQFINCVGTDRSGLQRVYFGNWLRDYSQVGMIVRLQINTYKLNERVQAMDVAGLAKLSRQAILNLVMALGFLAHGYATGEFEVTEERLGVYL